jgi:hypothetical protein
LVTLALAVNSATIGAGIIGTATIEPSSGVPGTTITVTGSNCGNFVSVAFIPDTGQLKVTYGDDWPAPYAGTVILGTTNDASGIATATFQLPAVAAGTYSLIIECVTPVGSGSVGAAALGPYTPGTVTVIAPATTPAQNADPVPAQAQTTG